MLNIWDGFVIFYSLFLVPICFSIKKPKEEELAVRSALPYEESEGEDGENDRNADVELLSEPNEESCSNNAVMDVDTEQITSPKFEKPDVETVSSMFKASEMTLEKWGL